MFREHIVLKVAFQRSGIVLHKAIAVKWILQELQVEGYIRQIVSIFDAAYDLRPSFSLWVSFVAIDNVLIPLLTFFPFAAAVAFPQHY